MKYYAVVVIAITDSSWIAEYVANVTPLIEERATSRRPRNVDIA